MLSASASAYFDIWQEFARTCANHCIPLPKQIGLDEKAFSLMLEIAMEFRFKRSVVVSSSPSLILPEGNRAIVVRFAYGEEVEFCAI